MGSICRFFSKLDQRRNLAAIIKGSILVMAIRVAGAGSVYASHVLLARWMGRADYGVFVYAWTWVTVLAVLACLGFDNASVRFIPEYLTKQAWRPIAGIIQAARRTTATAGAAIAILGIMAVQLMGQRIDPAFVVPMQTAFLCVPLFALTLLYTGFARSFGWVGLAYSPQFIARPIVLTAAVGALLASGAYPSDIRVMKLAFLTCIIILVAQAAFFARSLPCSAARAQPVYHMRHWRSVSMPLLLIQSYDLILAQADVLLLGLFVQPGDVAVYHAAVRTAGLISMVLYAVVALAGPKFASLAAEGKSAELETVALGSAHLVFWPSLIVAALLLLFGEKILDLFGEGFAAGYPLLATLILGHMFVATTGPVSTLLNMTGFQNQSARVLGCSATANIVLNFALIPLWGATGAAVATVASMVLAVIWFVIISKQRFGFYPSVFSLRLLQTHR